MSLTYIEHRTHDGGILRVGPVDLRLGADHAADLLRSGAIEACRVLDNEMVMNWGTWITSNETP